MCLNMAAFPRHTLHPKPCSRVMSDLCLRGHHAPRSSCHGVFTLLYSPLPACSLHTRVLSAPSSHPTPHFQAGRENCCWGAFVVVSLLRHGPSFLHGGLVSDCSLASGDFLRWIAGVRKDHCLCRGGRNLSSTCHLSPTSHPVPIFSGSRGLPAAFLVPKSIFIVPLAVLARRPSHLFGPQS